jgi:hypothetical protein
LSLSEFLHNCLPPQPQKRNRNLEQKKIVKVQPAKRNHSLLKECRTEITFKAFLLKKKKEITDAVRKKIQIKLPIFGIRFP